MIKKKPSFRRKEQFHCSTECNKYFLTYLRSNLNGNYAIRCPNCDHLHYRSIKNGLVTDDRRNDMKDQLDIIEGMASTISDIPHDLDKVNLRSITPSAVKSSWLKEISINAN